MKFFERVWEYYLRLRYKIGSKWDNKNDFYLYVNDYICNLKNELDNKIEACQRFIEVCGKPCIKEGEEIIYTTCAGFNGEGTILECYSVKANSSDVIPCYNGNMDVDIVSCYSFSSNVTVNPCYNFNVNGSTVSCYNGTFTGAVVFNIGYGTRVAK